MSLVLPSLVSLSLWITPVKISISGLIYVTGVTVTGVTFLMDNTSEDQYIRSYVQCPPLILAPLINMSKGSCENKSALFILLIFHSINSQNSNLSLK